MIKSACSFQRSIITTLRALIFVSLITICNTTAAFSNIDLSSATLDPDTTGFIITGNTVGDQIGTSVSSAGDIDNDGYDDIIIGAPYRNSNQGAAYVIYGCEKTSITNIYLSTQTLNPASTGFIITGNAGGDQFGSAVNTAGDINNDGYDDIIIGAFAKNSFQGVVYVIYGGPRSSMANIALSTALNPATTGFMITGNSGGDQFGYRVSTAGDVNNDGYDDIIIGADGVSTSQGAAYVIYGGEKSSMTNIALSTQILNPATTGFKITGNAAGDHFGHRVNTAGDINNDGYDDIIVGAYGINTYQGAAYVIYGGEKSSMTNIALSTQILNPAITGFQIAGSAASDFLGWSVSSAGDMNNDGYDDIVIGADGINSKQGVTYVIYGGEKSSMTNIAFSTMTLDPATTGFKITGNAPGDFFANWVSTAGDINNDGYDDIVVGAYGKNSNTGTVYVIYGGEKSSMANIFLSTTTLDPLTTGFMITGNAAGDKFGSPVTTAGDFNKDGFSDIIVGDPAKEIVYLISPGT